MEESSTARRGGPLGSLALHFLLGFGMALATLAMMAFWVPFREKQLGTNYLIFFYHFPSAMNCLIFFGIAGLASVSHLARGSARSDHAALGAVEVGVLGCTITMVTGSIWAKAAWSVFWVWEDPRLMTVTIMWFTFLGYLALRAAIDSPLQRSRFAAVVGAIGALNIPVVWFSIQVWGHVSHPPKLEADPPMRVTMWFGVLAFFVLYTAFWRTRMRVARLRDEAARLEEALASAEA